MPTTDGYYRYPTIHGDTVVFVSEDDLFAVPAEGGRARRLTASPGRNLAPRFSPDGSMLAYASRDEGETEVWVMPGDGGEAVRLTFTGGTAFPLCFSADGERIYLSSSHASSFARERRLFSVPATGGPLAALPCGPGTDIALGGPNGALVLGRNTADPAKWKRYRGGTVGQLWLDPDGAGTFHPLALEGNLACPMWVGGRLYFLSDFEGTGNLYSVTFEGTKPVDLVRHTDHEDFYARNPSTDGKRIVYHAGGALYLLEPGSPSREIAVGYATARAERQRRFADAGEFLQGFDPHPEGHSLAVIARGRAFTFGGWEGAVRSHQSDDGARRRMARWLHDGERFVCVSDASGEETLEVHRADGIEAPKVLGGLDLGRLDELEASPTADVVAGANHRAELVVVDLTAGEAKVVDKSEHGALGDLSFSPDGRWLAYACPTGQHTQAIRIVRLDSGEVHEVTSPVLQDSEPAWDPKGRWLYFISARIFDPVYDALHFDLGFPKGEKLYAVCLRRDVPSPFVPEPRPLKPKDDKDEKEDKEEKAEKPAKSEKTGDGDSADDADEETDDDAPEPVEIDFDGLGDRVVAFPLAEARYGTLAAIEGKILYTTWPVVGALSANWRDPDGGERGTLFAFELEKQASEQLATGITTLRLSTDGSTLAYRSGSELRIISAGEKAPEEEDDTSRRTGWVDLGRLRVAIDPVAEWKQIFREAWRLQRDHFWTPDMADIDWQAVHDRYLPLVDRVGSRSELSDVLWEMQGELGTSHAYEYGGDYRPEPAVSQGHLGCDLVVDDATGEIVIDRIFAGDPWDEDCTSPLMRPGVDVRPGDRLLAVGGVPVGPKLLPAALLVQQAEAEVVLTVRRGDADPRQVTVRTLGGEMALHYREWVSANRRAVHEATGGRVGYVHIPDMGANGYAEFHRAFLVECDRDALVVDVRHNGGGHVSQLLLEKLARRRIGYDQPRHQKPVAYPEDSPAGPLVCLTDEMAGSDGDIFSHCFKLMKLGPLVGKRTWGGVTGIDPHYWLVDGGLTTQPEYAFWFSDVGWAVENYGTDPDIEVDIAPHDWAAGRDPQLERGIAEALKALEASPPVRPAFGPRPSRARPKLPSRGRGGPGT